MTARAEQLRFDRRWLGSALRTLVDLAAPRQPRWRPGERRDGVMRRSLRREGADLSGLVAGDAAGRRVVFVHGSPSSAEDWAHLLTGVPPGLEFVAVDRPGFGWSGPDAVPTDLGEQAAALAPLLEARQGRRPILVGYSMGAPIAARAAVDFPDRVAGLALIGGALSAELERAHPLQHLAARPWIARRLPRALRNSNAELLALKGQLPDLAGRLGALTMPVTLLHGTDDPLVPFANMAYVADRLTGSPKVRCVTVPAGDHFLPWSHPGMVRDAVVELARLADRVEARQPA